MSQQCMIRKVESHYSFYSGNVPKDKQKSNKSTWSPIMLTVAAGSIWLCASNSSKTNTFQ